MTDYKGNVKGTLANSDPLNKEKSIYDLLAREDT